MVLRASCSSARRRRPTIRRRGGQRVRKTGENMKSSNCSSGPALSHIVQTCFSDLSVKLKWRWQRWLGWQRGKCCGDDGSTGGRGTWEGGAEGVQWGVVPLRVAVWPDHGSVMFKLWARGQEAWYLGVPGLSISFRTIKRINFIWLYNIILICILYIYYIILYYIIFYICYMRYGFSASYSCLWVCVLGAGPVFAKDK